MRGVKRVSSSEKEEFRTKKKGGGEKKRIGDLTKGGGRE